MNREFPVIRYTGLTAYVETYAKAAHAYPVFSLFGAKTSVQAIAAALLSRKDKIFLIHEARRQDVYLSHGDHRVFSRTLPCGMQHVLVIDTMALYKHCRLPSFLIACRSNEDEKVRFSYFSFLDRLVPIPLLRNWSGWLWRRGIDKGEIQPLESHGLTAHECRVDLEGLKADLTIAMKEGELDLKEDRNAIGR